jgi:uncharacterized protein (DUF779 family)
MYYSILAYTTISKEVKFDLLSPPTDSHDNVIGDNDIPITVIDDVNKEVSSTSYKQQKYWQHVKH